MEKDATLVWENTNGKNQLKQNKKQKTDNTGKITKTREKLQKTHKKKTAAYVSADLVGHFFLFAEKGKSSSNRT